MDVGTDVTGPISREQRATVEALLRERDLAPRARAGGDGQGGGAGVGPHRDRGVGWPDGGDGAALAGGVPGRRRDRVGRCATHGATAAGRRGLPDRAGDSG